MGCKGSVLVVDDDPDLREALARALESLGCTAAIAVDGLDALARLEEAHRPCFVLLDLNMPRLDGENFTRIVRSDPERSSLPIVTMSAGKNKLTNLGVEAHFEKPFSFDALVAMVMRFCREVPCLEGAPKSLPGGDAPQTLESASDVESVRLTGTHPI